MWPDMIRKDKKKFQQRHKANLKRRTLYQQRGVPSADKLLFSLTAQLADQDVFGYHTLEISV
jgi:hypothetical protein